MTRPVTVVTGGSRGIGAATSMRLAADEHDVALGYVRDGEAAERTAVSPCGRRVPGASGRHRPLDLHDPHVHYAATKAAVDALTLVLAKELGPDGIRVNAVAPGVIGTDIHRAMGDPGRPERVAATTPLRRAGRAEEVAAAIAWLMSPESSCTTGAVLRVAGGQ